MADGSSRYITVACSHHHDALANGLWNFFSEKIGVDFNLRWGGRMIRAHNLILQVFLSPEKLEQVGVDNAMSKQDQCPLVEVNGEAGIDQLDSLIEFIYNGKVTVLEEKLDDLLKIATELDFKMLVDSIASCQPIGERSTENETTVSGRTPRKSTPRRLKREVLTSESDSDEEWTQSIRKRSCTAVKKFEVASRPAISKKRKAVAELLPSANAVDDALDDSSISNVDFAVLQPIVSLRRIGSSKRRLVSKKSTVVRKRRVASLKKTRTQTSVINGDEVIPGALDETDEQLSDIESTNSKSKSQGRQLFTCEPCGLQFNWNRQYQIHMSRHDPNIVVFRCIKCPKIFLSPGLLEEHSQLHADEPESYDCDQCDYKNPRKDRYLIHMTRHGSVDGVVKCEICCHAFFSKERMEIHMAKHKSHRCPHCDYETLKYSSMHSHLASRHEVTAKGQTLVMYECEMCDYKCKRAAYMKYHVAAKHSDERPHKCPQCPFTGVRKTDVGKHINAVHLNVKPHLCEQCGYRTVSQSLLATHVRTHSGEKPFKCKECNKCYRDNSTLRHHIQMYHGNGGPGFICHICGNVLRRRVNLRRHLKNVHKIVPGVDMPISV